MRLQDLLNGERVYPRLCEFFRRADERYNSGIFHFEKEPGRESPDTLTLILNIDDKPLKEIIKRLYYPDSPYEFSMLPAEILGQVYEQFLGKVIRLTEGHRAVVEDKPEVKKAGGVKYTPVYIVQAIVSKTLGPTLEGKTPLEVVLISVLDPACGSGSFLIVAYQYLMDWHREWYIQNLVPLLQSGLKPSSPEIRRLRELRACDYYDEFEKPKIMYLVFQVKPAFTFDEAGTYANNAVWITPISDKTLLGILNSKLGWFMISNYCTQIQNGYQLIFNYLGKIPIRVINFSDSQDVARDDRMVSLVDRMLSLHKQLKEARTPHEQTALQRQIEATDRQIDALVYELYGLTEEEIRIVEGAQPK
jgi:hypothetical protein